MVFLIVKKVHSMNRRLKANNLYHILVLIIFMRYDEPKDCTVTAPAADDPPIYITVYSGVSYWES